LSDEGASLDGFSQLNASFSSEAGGVKHIFPFSFPFRGKYPKGDRVFFLVTFCIKTKSKSGFGAEAPLKILLSLYTDNHKKQKANDILQYTSVLFQKYERLFSKCHWPNSKYQGQFTKS